MDGATAITIVTAFDGERTGESGEKIRGLFPKHREKYRIDIVRFHLFCLHLLTQIFRFRAADVVHVVRGGPEAMISVLLSRMLGKRVIVKVARNEFETKGGVGLLSGIRRLVASRADVLVALSETIRAELAAVGVPHHRIVAIPNAVDTARFHVIEDDEREDLFQKHLGRPRLVSEKVLLFVGSITVRKGVSDLFAALEKADIGCPLAIVLIGPDYREIGNFEDSVEYLSSIRQDLVVRYMGESRCPEEFMQFADSLVLPSYSEGMPNVVLEGLACGLHAIVSDLQVNQEVVVPELGTTFPVGNADALADRIADMTRLPVRSANERRGVSARILEKYGTEAVAAQYMRLYRDLAAGRRDLGAPAPAAR